MKCLSVMSRLTLGVCLSWGTSEIRQTLKAFEAARGNGPKRRRHIACNQRDSHAYLPLIVAVRNHPAAPVQSPPPDAASPLGVPAAYKRSRPWRRRRRRVNAHRAQAAVSVDASEICVIFQHEYSFLLEISSLELKLFNLISSLGEAIENMYYSSGTNVKGILETCRLLPQLVQLETVP